jgi:hypothetical protein
VYALIRFVGHPSEAQPTLKPLTSQEEIEMKPKLVFAVLAGLMICLIFSTSQGADNFYFGSYGGIEHASILKDSLKFNIIEQLGVDSSNIGSLVDGRLRAIVHAVGDSGPTDWAWLSHYTLWEEEPFPGSNFYLHFNGGTLENDPLASGGKVRKFVGPGDPGIIQWGPTYYQERVVPERPNDIIEYTAEFRMKYLVFTPRGAMGGIPPGAVCRLMVMNGANVLKDTTLYRVNFTGGYQSFKLKYTVPGPNAIDFRIYWFGISGALYVDYVKTYDDYGHRLIELKLADQRIMNYVSQSWVDTTIPGTGETVVYRWYGRDEPPSIDLYMPHKYIDSLLGEVSTERVLFQAFSVGASPDTGYEYLLRENPKDFCVDIFPMGELGHETTGYNYQHEWGEQIEFLNRAKTKADSLNKDFWLVPQTWTDAYTDTLNCDYYPLIYWDNRFWCPHQRDPSQYELRLQTFLGLCYGADGILYFLYDWWESWAGMLLTGLYDPKNNIKTHKWREIKDFTGPRVDKLGPVLNDLTWLGAGFFEDAATITGSFIDSLRSVPGETLTATYVQVGFFKDVADTDYFMLVNRQCLANEEQNVTVYMDSAKIGNKKMWYVIDQYSQDSTFTGAINGAIPFTTHLNPGEGKLFKLVPFSDNAFHGIAHPLTWQGGIVVDGDVTVDSAKTLVIQPPALIHFMPNTDVKGTWNPDQCELIIYGGLRAVGSETDSIYFTSTGDTPDEWATIRVFSMPPCSTNLSFCVVEFAYIGIMLVTPGLHTISHCRFHNNEVTGIVADTAKYALIMDNLIYADTISGGLDYGISLDWAGPSSKIERNMIRNYDWAGIRAYGCSTTMDSNYILNTGSGFESDGLNNLTLEKMQIGGEYTGVGLELFPAGNDNITVTSCHIIGDPNGPMPIGVDVYPRSGIPNYLIRKSKIKDFSEKGIWCRGTTNIDLGTEEDYGTNEIETYVDSALYVSVGGVADSVKAVGNWWGASPPDPTRFVGPVDYTPWLTSPPPDSMFEKIVASSNTPDRFQLSQNCPNPFNPVTSIQFTIGNSQFPIYTTLKIYNILGQLVRTLVDEEKSEGDYTIHWDGRNMKGETVSSGIYFYRLEVGELSDVKKMVLLR